MYGDRSLDLYAHSIYCIPITSVIMILSLLYLRIIMKSLMSFMVSLVYVKIYIHKYLSSYMVTKMKYVYFFTLRVSCDYYYIKIRTYNCNQPQKIKRTQHL